MANSILNAVLAGLGVELAWTMGIECVAQLCHYHLLVDGDVVSRVVEGIFPIGDGLA